MDLNKFFSSDNKAKEWRPTPKLIPVIEKAIVKYNEERKQDSPTMFRCSEIGGCDRKALLKHQGHKEEITPASYMIMNVGTAIHELIQTYIAEHLVSLEERLYFNEFLSGSYDGELDAKILGEKKNGLLEIKTTGVNNYQRLIKNQSQLSNKYKFQNNAYLHSKGLDWTIFVFVNRNLQFTDEFIEENKDKLHLYNPIFHEIIYRKDDLMVEKIRQKITERKLCMELKTLPKRVKMSECSYCSFGPSGNNVCEEKHKEEKVIEKTEKESLKQTKKQPKKKRLK